MTISHQMSAFCLLWLLIIREAKGCVPNVQPLSGFIIMISIRVCVFIWLSELLRQEILKIYIVIGAGGGLFGPLLLFPELGKSSSEEHISNGLFYMCASM